jgi:hypothetical protein
MTKATMQAAAFVLAGAALLALAQGDDAAVGLATSASQVEINTGVLKAQLYLADPPERFLPRHEIRLVRCDWQPGVQRPQVLWSVVHENRSHSQRFHL